MTIGIVHHRYHPNLEGLIFGLLESGHRVYLFLRVDSDYAKLSTGSLYDSLYVVSLDSINIWNVFNLVKSTGIDFMIYRHVGHGFIRFAIVGLLLGIKRIEYDQSVLYGSNPIKQLFKPLLRLFTGRPIRKWTAVLMKEELNRWKEPFTCFIHLPVLVNGHSKTVEYGLNRPLRVLLVGKLKERRKNHLSVLESLANNKSISVTITGSSSGAEFGEREYYQDLLNAVKAFGDFVRIKPNLSLDEMAQEYKQHDILIFPSYKESLGFAVLEAMSHGLCVICNKDVGAASYIDHLGTGLLYNSNEPLELESLVNEILLGNLQISKLGEAARLFIQEECDPLSQSDKILSYGKAC